MYGQVFSIKGQSQLGKNTQFFEKAAMQVRSVHGATVLVVQIFGVGEEGLCALNFISSDNPLCFR